MNTECLNMRKDEKETDLVQAKKSTKGEDSSPNLVYRTISSLKMSDHYEHAQNMSNLYRMFKMSGMTAHQAQLKVLAVSKDEATKKHMEIQQR